MKVFFLKFKIYLLWFFVVVFAFLVGLILYKNKNINGLELLVKEKIKELEVQKEALRNEKKNRVFEVLDISENTQVLKDFREIDEKSNKEILQNEKKDSDPGNDTFNFTI